MLRLALNVRFSSVVVIALVALYARLRDLWFESRLNYFCRHPQLIAVYFLLFLLRLVELQPAKSLFESLAGV